jgi:hypothetical protein
MKFLTYVIVLPGLFGAACAVAEDVVPDHILACVSLRRDPERLACFDKAVLDLQKGTDTPAPSAENMFGATGDIANSSGVNREVQREELKQISAVVASLRRQDDGMILIGLDNGQSWRQQDKDVTLTIDVGDTVKVLRASLGTFRIADKRGRSARFKRVR